MTRYKKIKKKKNKFLFLFFFLNQHTVDKRNQILNKLHQQSVYKQSVLILQYYQEVHDEIMFHYDLVNHVNIDNDEHLFHEEEKIVVIYICKILRCIYITYIFMWEREDNEKQSIYETLTCIFFV